MNSMKTTVNLYCQYLMSSHINYTATHLSDHYEGLSHDSVTRFLRNKQLSPSMLWKKVEPLLIGTAQGCLIIDDSVLDKSHSFKIDGVQKQYSGNAHGIIKGIGVVNLLYYNPLINRYWLIDFRIFDPDKDGKTKLDHANEMLSLANSRGVLYSTVLMDSWYATSQLMVRLQTEGKIFYCPIKVNRQVDESGGKNPYQSVESLSWTEQELSGGKRVKIKKTSKHMKVQLFRVTITNRTEYIITNEVSQLSAEEALAKSSFRWKIEQLHREEKQLTGIEKCQARINRSQRNHILCCALVWLIISTTAAEQKTTSYQVKKTCGNSILFKN
jgi:hypothetical protein